MGLSRLCLSTPDQLESIALLLQSAFHVDAESPLLNRDYLSWKYYGSTLEESGSRSYILSEGSEITAHAVVWPLRLRLGTEIREGISFGDWVASNQHRGAGLTLLKQLMDLSSFVLVTGGSPITRAILPRAGFVPWGERRVYAKVIRPVLQAITRRDRKGWKEPLRLLRNAAWSVRRPAPTNGWTAEEVTPSDDLLASAGALPGTMHEAGYLRYMSRCPTVPERCFALRHNGRLTGYSMLGFAGGQTRVTELRIDANDQASWSSAVAAVLVVAAREPSTCEVSAFGSGHYLDNALIANGFQIRGHAPVVIFDRSGTLVEKAIPQLGMLEDDAASLFEPGFVYRT